MKKSIVIFVMIMILLSLVGCGKGETTETAAVDEITSPESEKAENEPIVILSEEESEKTDEPSETVTPTEEESQEIEVDEGLLNVKITIPAFFFEDQSDFDPDVYAEENGFKEAVVNEDGSVTVTMSKRMHNELMAEMETETDRILEELIESENAPYIKEITASKNYRTVTVSVDKEGYENTWDMTPISIWFSAALYQIIDGSEPQCEIIIEDIETGEVLYSEVFPDALEE